MPGFADILQAMAAAQGGQQQQQAQMPAGVQQVRPGQGAVQSPLDALFAQLQGGGGGAGGNPMAALLGGGGGGLGALLGGGMPQQQQKPQQSYSQQQASQQSSRPAQQVQIPVAAPAPSGDVGFNFEGGQMGGGAEMLKSHMGYYQSPGNKKALFIGINYKGTSAELAGCLNDVKNIHGWIMANYDFPPNNVLIMTDDTKDSRMIPTRRNIMAAMKWLVKGAKRGDSLFMHYSGHGGSQADTDGDEADGNDETIVPLDYETAGQIVDDEIWLTMVKDLPEGCHLTCIFDSCHSGSVMDLPFTYNADGNLDVVQYDNRMPSARRALRSGAINRANPNDAIMALFGGSGAFASGGAPDDASNMSLTPEQIQALVSKRASNGTVIQFAGCADKQTSADASIANQKTGAASWAFMQVMTKYKTPTYIQMLREMRILLQGKYQQVMQMSSAQQMNLDQPFTV